MTSKNDSKTMVFGVGAQKAGTTWLHAQLSAAPNADFGLLKEYHALDAVHIKVCRRFRVDTKPGFLKSRLSELSAKRRLRWKMQDDFEFYLNYFAGLLDQPGIEITGDITPSYSGLPVSVLRDVRDGFAKRDINVKAVFLMRDPVERCWSSVRMLRRKMKPGDKRVVAGLSEIEFLKDYYPKTGATMRTNYHEIINKLESVFEPENLYIGFYEDLFTAPTLQEISEKFGVPISTSAVKQKVNVSPKVNGEIPADLAHEIAEFYRPVYDFVENKFGRDRLRQLWPNAN